MLTVLDPSYFLGIMADIFLIQTINFLTFQLFTYMVEMVAPPLFPH